MRSDKSWLCAELMRTKSGYSDWAVNPKTIWPQWSWERLGALAMCSDPKGDKKRSLNELTRLADKRLADAGDRVAQVLFEAGFTEKQAHELWRLLQKAKRHREARHRLTQEHVDYLMRLSGPRRMGKWYKSLRTLRMYGTVQTD